MLDIKFTFARKDGMKSDITITEETRLILEDYFNKRIARKVKRKRKAALGSAESNVELENLLVSKPNRKRKVYSRCFKINQFDKHITNLEKLKSALENHQTVGGIPMHVDNNEAVTMDEAVRNIENAIELLSSLYKVV